MAICVECEKCDGEAGQQESGHLCAHKEMRQKVLELDVAGAVKNAGRREVDGADAPHAKREGDCLGANAARGKPSRGGLDPGWRLRALDHWAGSAFLSASSSACPERGALC